MLDDWALRSSRSAKILLPASYPSAVNLRESAASSRHQHADSHLFSKSATLSTLDWLYATISANMNDHADSDTSAPFVLFSGRSRMLAPAAGSGGCCWPSPLCGRGEARESMRDRGTWETVLVDVFVL